MAAFPQHMQFSTVLGVGYTAAMHWGLGYELPHSVVAGGLCSLCGMLPDLDSDSGRPLRELFPLLAAIGALVCFHRLGNENPDMRLILASGTYVLIRYGISFFVKRWSEHRGMFHSIPALLIPTFLAYLAWTKRTGTEGYVIAGGVALGYFSHLLLDEIYAIDFNGLSIKANQFSGTAVKLFHPKSWAANIFCWSICLFLGSRVAVEEGYLNEFMPTIKQLRTMKMDFMTWAGFPPPSQHTEKAMAKK
ncbi:MAG: metal-dependent hydrolase [Gemmatales bacterium]